MTFVEVARRTLAGSLRRCLAALFSLVLLGITLSACGGDQPACAGDLQPYQGRCLTNTAIVYLECTEGRGFSTSTDISGGVGGTFRVVADASLKAAYKKSQQENTPVALQIVRDCLTIAQQASSGSDRSVAQDFQRQAEQDLKRYQQQQIAEKPHITLSRSSAAIGETVVVKGRSYWPNETVEIVLHATTVKEVQADGNGAFQVSITVPDDAPPPSFSTAIMATGESSVKSARATFRTRS